MENMKLIEIVRPGWKESILGLVKFFAVGLLLVIGFWILCIVVFAILAAFPG